MEHVIDNNKISNSISSAFWITMILIALLITALNFAKPSYHHQAEEHGQTEAAPTGTVHEH